MESAIALVALAVIVAIFVRLAAGSMDGSRVDEYIQSRGGRLISLNWNPFGNGWLGSKNERIYDIEYEDKEGNFHTATVKTSLLAGVYFTEDQITRQAAAPAPSKPSLEAEVEALKKRLTVLEGGLRALSDKDKELFKRIDEVVHYKWDPIGVSGTPEARDEYDGYVPQIVSLVKAGDEAKLLEYLNSVARDRMGIMPSEASNAQVARTMMDWREFLLGRGEADGLAAETPRI